MKTLLSVCLICSCLTSQAVSDVTFNKKRLSPTLELARQELTAPGILPDITQIRVETRSRPSDGNDSYEITRQDDRITITAPTDLGALYGAYHLARLSASGAHVPSHISESPAFALRILNHWDNLDGTIERGYAGRSMWKWDELPDVMSPRYADYARRNASIGINATVLNNVNASPLILSTPYLHKIKALADTFRPYGIKVFLSVNFATPMALDSLPTADPLDPAVQKWWKRKADEIYSLIPDFGGFLVKANSEGQPGPMDFGRTHAEGANMLARALRPHHGIVMWRAFVYSPIDADRAKQAYMEFQPLDGRFDPNVIIQIKNGPIDFQPREAYSPLFGAMPATPQMVEFQVTQEYLGHANHLAFLAPMWQEFFSQVSPASLKAVAGVANVGDDPNMTGHPLADANWYAFGRLAWDPTLTPEAIAGEWIDSRLIDPAETPADIRRSLIDMFTTSRETVVDYMMPLGLHHIFAWGHHYGPEPWCDIEGARPDWMPSYYHRADKAGLGFDRTPSGSDAVSQYPDSLRSVYADISTCPENLLLWFHHVPWDHRMQSGRTMWQELCHRYATGAARAARYQHVWADARPYVSPAIWTDVNRRLITQARDAQWWKDACVLYFSQFSSQAPTPEVYPIHHTLPDLKHINLGIDNYTNPSPALLDSLR
ncbi:alpha-glucuronidase [Muribaculaceae bacterium Isolate-110 (HZI)]|nr:alpha-glucuronidase [Muribaculaceae bacterium Isolate-110 (HZI)]